jgi:hypothetical protein
MPSDIGLCCRVSRQIRGNARTDVQASRVAEGGSRRPPDARGPRARKAPPASRTMHEPGFSECLSAASPRLGRRAAPEPTDPVGSWVARTMTAVTGASDADFETGVIGGPTLHDDTIRLVEHDPAWPERFEQGAARIRALLGPAALRGTTSARRRCPGRRQSRSSTSSSPWSTPATCAIPPVPTALRHRYRKQQCHAPSAPARLTAGDRGRGGCALSAVDDAAGRDYVARLSDCGQAVDKRRSVRHASRPAPRGRSS